MSQSIGINEARQIIREIVREHGFVQESTLQLINSLVSQEARREVEEALLAKDKKIGSSVLVLAKNLYSSKARFVFELLQNADDNQYTRGQDPRVAFRVHPNQIIIECNEDGFTRQNLTAICDVGQSSKTGSQGYIGEKGIGFKSVFMTAWKVHIQSGNFSFEFIHRQGDSGMGMITPIWQETRDPDPPSASTRITLYLHDYSDLNKRDKERKIIREQFHELQDTLLLFLRKLRIIEVSFHDEEGNQTECTIDTLSRMEDSDATIIERKCTDKTKNRRRIYRIHKHIARGLARSDNRDLSEAEETSRSFATSEIVLAFPVTPESVPIVESQEVYAFLPIKQIGFNFLIQADFVIQANRQDIVMTSERNEGLIEAIADVFIASVLQLCQHPKLQYQWMRYLPLEETYPWSGLWKDLVSSIKFKIESLTVFRSLERNTRRTIKDLYYLNGDNTDRHGNPLFADLRPEIYLSDLYEPADIAILKHVGLQSLPLEKSLATVERDLQAGLEHSRIKSPNNDDKWQTKAYSLLNLFWAHSQSNLIRGLKQLNIIPLQDGSWVSSNSGDIFYPKYDDIVVPKDLGIRLVDPAATKNESRRVFFENLGVHPIDMPIVSNIRERILRRPAVPGTISSLESSIERMRFLFLTQHLYPEEGALSDKFTVYDHLGVAIYPSVTDLYISNDDPYGAELFLRQKSRQVSCVNSRYFEEIPSTTPDSDLSLHQWMYEHLGIRQHLRLVSSDQKSLSVECLDTASTRAPEFLGFLRYLWSFEGHIVIKNNALLGDLQATEVLCMHESMERLDSTFLPLKPLSDVHKRYLGDEYFPFLQSPELIGHNEVSHLWSFLTKYLEVGSQDCLGFRLALMSQLKKENPDAQKLKNPSRVVELYQSMDAFLQLSEDRAEWKKVIGTSFNVDGLIFVPPWESKPASWKEPDECLWDAPSNFITKVPLKEIYVSSFQNLGVELDHAAGFFHGTLDIPDIDWHDVIAELEELKLQPIIRGEVVRQLYGILFAKFPGSEVDSQEIRDSFETKALIYFDHNGSPGWYKPSECVWSDTTRIHGKIALNSQYSEFKDLLEELQVLQLDLKMVLDQLLEAKALNLPVAEVKELFKTLNSFLRAEPNPPSPSRLLKARVFPVRDPSSGNVSLCTSNTQFALVDREGPPSQFIEKVRVLDFTLQEICQLEPLLVWTHLDSRYLSRHMKETSRLGDGLGVSISQPRRDVRRKAHALLRIAAAFNSPRWEADPPGLYNILRTIRTLESGVISSTLSFEQDGIVHEIEVGQSELHIEDRTPLTVYVPDDTECQECCFQCDLPHRFASWMMTDPTSGLEAKIEDRTVKVISSILNCSVSTTARILEKEGIPHVPEVPETLLPVKVDEPAKHTTEAVAPDVGGQNELLPWSQNRSLENERSSSPESISSAPRIIWSPTREESTRDQPTPFTDPEDFDSENNLDARNDDDSTQPPEIHILAQQSISQYGRLLEGVVALAKRTTLPSNNEDMSTAFQDLSLEDPFDGLYYEPTSNDWEHKKKAGAAGELFVFEILKSYLGEKFDLSKWKSKIRGYASVLPKYANLKAWPDPETSDIVYRDETGSLTCLMISLGFLNADHWAGKKPEYYIEVKCTTGDCVTPFIVSQNQVDLMKRKTNGPQGDQNQTAVYALFRVFDLGRSSMGLKIYIDPAEQMRAGKLAFTTKKYAVVPTPRQAE